MLKARGLRLGRKRGRQLLTGLGLAHEPRKKQRRAILAITARAELPEERRVQIDSTRLSLAGGVAWVYVVEDVASRVCLAASVGRSLSQERAAHMLHEGHHLLRQYGITISLVIRSDAGLDFTSEYFQRCSQTRGQWVRCRVNQIGGMGILERLHLTFKYDFVFRHEVTTSGQLRGLVPQFQD